MAHSHFVKIHVDYGVSDSILTGRRVEIGRELTDKLLASGTVLNSLTPELIWDSIWGRSRKAEEAIMVRSPFLRRLMHRDRMTDDGVWGCNFSLTRDLFIAINGCDEDFLDGSIEDNDLGVRVLNQGKRILSVRGLAIIFHLWHKSSWSFQNHKYLYNQAILKRRIANKEQFCLNGIYKIEKQYLKAG